LAISPGAIYEAAHAPAGTDVERVARAVVHMIDALTQAELFETAATPDARRVEEDACRAALSFIHASGIGRLSWKQRENGHRSLDKRPPG
jgi:hypothetical protein